MTLTAVRPEKVCPRCDSILLSDAGEPYCLVHGHIEVPLVTPGTAYRETYHPPVSVKAPAVVEIITEIKKENIIVTKTEKGHSKYDHLIPQLVEDLQTMTTAKTEKKHGLYSGFLSSYIPAWQKRGLMPVDVVHFKGQLAAPVKPTSVKPSVKTAGDNSDTITVKTRWAKIEETPEPAPAPPADKIDYRSMYLGYRQAVLDLQGVKQ